MIKNKSIAEEDLGKWNLRGLMTRVAGIVVGLNEIWMYCVRRGEWVKERQWI